MSAMQALLNPGAGRAARARMHIARRAGEMEEALRAMDDAQLAAQLDPFRGAEQIARDELAEVLAVAREAARRATGLRMYDEQLLGAIAIYDGAIAELKTGEGKTLTAVGAVVARALSGGGVHVATANPYLAARDAEWMGPAYRLLGLSVSAITPESRPEERRLAYECDITYSTMSELGFDHLRDTLAQHRDGVVQRRPHVLLVDEADSLLIDEARTPMVLSGEEVAGQEEYLRYAEIARALVEDEDYIVDYKKQLVSPTEEGVARIEQMLDLPHLYMGAHGGVLHRVLQAIRAEALYERDRQYLVSPAGTVEIIDEHTGRVLPGRIYSDGLHQAIEAKEGVQVRPELQTLATISVQSFVRRYPVVCGMTGTAMTDAKELEATYGTTVVEIPTHRPVQRLDEEDLIFRTHADKMAALITEVGDAHARRQPVLVGTASVESAEEISRALEAAGIAHQLLSAKEHAREAEIIAGAGAPGQVTVATNMAGRGVDIAIDDEVRALGGLYVIGAERHASRRIDDQLRGRAGRQGDPGRSRFFVSAEDDLVRRFAGDHIARLMDRISGDGQPISMRQLSSMIEGAQEKLEDMNREVRKNLIEYDEVAITQRSLVLDEREALIEGFHLAEHVRDWMIETMIAVIDDHLDDEGLVPDDISGMVQSLAEALPTGGWQGAISGGGTHQDLLDQAEDHLMDTWSAREARLGDERAREIERYAALTLSDRYWREHLTALEDLRRGIGLRSLANRSPIVEYRMEASDMFESMRQAQRDALVRYLLAVEICTDPEINTEGVARLRPA